MQQVLKDILSVKGLIMLIALVALGLSITAVVRGCEDNFGDICGRIINNTVNTKGCTNNNGDIKQCNSLMDCQDLPGSLDPIDKTPTNDCKCQPFDGPAACQIKGASCEDTNQCCTHNSEGNQYIPPLQCLNGKCQQPGTGTCKQQGEQCKTPDECCSNNCLGNDTGGPGGICGLPTDEDEHHYHSLIH